MSCTLWPTKYTFFRIVSSVLPACPLILDFLFLERLEAFLTSEEVQCAKTKMKLKVLSVKIFV